MSPLSELVWSLDEGLSLRVTPSSLRKKKASLCWNTDTFSIVISSAQLSGGGKSSDNKDMSVRDEDKLQLPVCSYSGSPRRASMASPRRSNADVNQASSIRSQKQESKSRGEIKLLNKLEEEFDNGYVDTKQLEEEEVGNGSLRCSKDASHDKTSCQGPAFKNELTSSIAEKELPCASTVRKENFRMKNCWNSRLMGVTGVKNSALPKDAINTVPPSSLKDQDYARNISGQSRSSVGEAQNRSSDNKRKEIGAIVASRFWDAFQDENMLQNYTREPVVARSESASHVNPRYQDKGKEKVFNNGLDCASNAKESDDSNESIESTPSMKLPERKRAQHSFSEMPLGSKRCRKEDNESSYSGALLGNGSSFLNWISTLTNGTKMFDQKSAPTLPLNQRFPAIVREDFGSPPVSHRNNDAVPLQAVGFNSLFQSLYCHNIMITSSNYHHERGSNHLDHAANGLMLDLKDTTSAPGEPNHTSAERFHVASETFAVGNLQIVSDGEAGSSQNQVGVLPLPAIVVSESNHTSLRQEQQQDDILACIPGNTGLSNPSSKSSHGSPKEKQAEMNCCSSNMVKDVGSGFMESVWVTRLLPKVSSNLSDPVPCNMRSELPAAGPNDLANTLHHYSSQEHAIVSKECKNLDDSASERRGEKIISSTSSVLPSKKHKKSESMANVFAKRLDALRHAKPSAAIKLDITCRRASSEVRNHSSSSFLVTYTSHDRIEGEPESHSSPGKDKRLVLWSGDRKNEQQQNNGHGEPRGKLIPENEVQPFAVGTSDKVVATRADDLEAKSLREDRQGRERKLKEQCSSTMENLSNRNRIIPYGSVMHGDVRDESSAIFETLRRLRLSRKDIVRLLRSPATHASLDGFFLRLRLGKLEEALGGTGYHVARINGATDENSLSVTIRNSACLVDSRFVSNNDFLEDELKAWWSAALKGDCKLPSKEELDMKLKVREMLHF